MNKHDLLKLINGGKSRGAQAKLASEVGISTASVANWFSGKSYPSEENIKKMSKIFNKSVEELHRIWYEEENINAPIAEEVMLIPVLGTSSASEEKFILEELESYLPIKKSTSNQFAIRVEGNCMVDPDDPQNSIYHGNYIIVDPEAEASAGDVVLARICGEYSTIKRFFPSGETVELVPDNPKFRPLVFPTNDIEIIGKVVNVYRPVKKKHKRN